MASDSEWRALKERAEAAGMDASRYIFERLAAPAAAAPPPWAAELAGRVERVERLAGVLYEVERQRLAANGESATWAALERRVDERLEVQARLG